VDICAKADHALWAAELAASTALPMKAEEFSRAQCTATSSAQAHIPHRVGKELGDSIGHTHCGSMTSRETAG
jgi:hypothetical protein